MDNVINEVASLFGGHRVIIKTGEGLARQIQDRDGFYI
jgi:hypothetical protein